MFIFSFDSTFCAVNLGINQGRNEKKLMKFWAKSVKDSARQVMNESGMTWNELLQHSADIRINVGERVNTSNRTTRPRSDSPSSENLTIHSCCAANAWTTPFAPHPKFFAPSTHSFTHLCSRQPRTHQSLFLSTIKKEVNQSLLLP